MSTIAVYRTFYWTGDRLAGQTGFIWPTKEVRARCIKEEPLNDALFPRRHYPKPTEKEQEYDAAYHIEIQTCLCGIHGCWSPSYLSLIQPQVQSGLMQAHNSATVFGRVLLFGLVSLHGLGARGEYGMIEELWCDKDIEYEVKERYHVPVNRSKYDDQPRTTPILDKGVKTKKLAPLFEGLTDAVAAVNSGMLGSIVPGPTIRAMSFSQWVAKYGPLGSASTLSNALGISGLGPPPPPWASKLLQNIHTKQRAMYTSSFNSPGPACARNMCYAALKPSLLSFQAGPSASGIGTGPPHNYWKCGACGMYEMRPNDHTAKRCIGNLPKLGLIGVDTTPKSKPGTLARIKKVLGG